jgi:hypothetical protein
MVASYTILGLRRHHMFLYTQGARMLKTWGKLNFTNVLEGDILEDEVAFDQFGSYSLI